MSDKTIQCVDDETIVLSSLRDQIARRGDRYRYEMAESADEAWEIIEITTHLSLILR